MFLHRAYPIIQLTGIAVLGVAAWVFYTHYDGIMDIVTDKTPGAY